MNTIDIVIPTMWKADTFLESLVGSKNLFNWRDHRRFVDWIVRRKQPETIVDLGGKIVP